MDLDSLAQISFYSTYDRLQTGGPHNLSNEEYLTTAVTGSSLADQHGDAAQHYINDRIKNEHPKLYFYKSTI